MKEVYATILWIFIGLAFASAGAWIFLGVLRPPIAAKKILKNGIETTAILVDIGSNLRKSSSNGKSDEQYYYLTLCFVNSAGKTVNYKTNSIYPESFIREMSLAQYNEESKAYNIPTKEAIPVICLDNKAVVKGFFPDRGVWWFWILSFAFFLLGIGMIVSYGAGVVNIIAESVIKRHGTPTTGVYSSHTYDTVISSATLYIIYFTFENANGDTITGKKSIANSDIEAEMLIELGSFPIKYIGNKATIMLNHDEILQYYERKTLERRQ